MYDPHHFCGAWMWFGPPKIQVLEAWSSIWWCGEVETEEMDLMQSTLVTGSWEAALGQG